MPEVQAAPASAPNAEAVTGTPGAPATQAPEAVSAEKFNALSNQVAALTRLMQKAATPNATPTPPDPARPSLAKHDEELKRMADGLKTAAKRTEVKAAVAEKLGARTEHFARYVLSVHGDRIKVTDDMQVYVDDEGTPTPVTQWADAFLKTAEGQMFMPAPVPAPSPIPNGTGGKQTQRHPYADLKYSDLMTKAKENFSEYLKFAREFPEQFKAVTDKK